jgi:hypothetical protein
LAPDFKDPAKSAGGAAANPGAGIALTNQQLADLAGLYWNPDGDEFVKTYLKDGKLRVSLDDYALKPVSETFFHIADVSWGDQANLHFEPAAGNNPRPLLNVSVMENLEFLILSLLSYRARQRAASMREIT